MVIIIAVAGAIAAVLTAAGMLWARARRLQQELSELRVQRAFEWVITGRAPQDLSPTPEQRRAAFYLIRGGSAAAASLLSARVVAGLRHAREHPALTTASLTALTAACVILVLAAVHSSPNSHAGPARPPSSTARLTSTPTRPTSGPPAGPTAAPSPPPPPAGTPSAPAPERPTGSAPPTAGAPSTPPSGPATSPTEGTPSPSTSATGGPTAEPPPPEPDECCLLDLQVSQALDVDVCVPVRSAP